MNNQKDVKLKSGNRALMLLCLVLVIFLIAGALYGIRGSLFPAFGMRPPEIDVAAFSHREASQYTTVVKGEDGIHQGDLVLVNKTYPYRGQDSTPLTYVYDYKNNMYKVKDMEVSLNRRVVQAFNGMLAGFYDATGIHDVNVVSGYRSSEDQYRIVQEKQSETLLQNVSSLAAAPGYSEHETGMALDLSIYTDMGITHDFLGQGKYHWIRENAYRYGFVLRYPQEKTQTTGYDYEPWHYRFVGVPHAGIMQKENICLEEYIDFLKQYPYEKQHLKVRTQSGQRYEIYYVAAEPGETAVPVPSNREYTLSGNNADGFIVTVTL
ncbi:D-Ala-D-Ala carboxypeptidase VanY [Candidatus Soleaferrea massiliensis]|uniref:D-Ala-D-Ala carboxypeptidase VanY n=1 Tax=Candidatus Soleaferrea massiliensis TaxID=1470354 RepID=UPI00059123B1|nr:D-Ala-D-Ala carboxypeptidase VanY [Candidatus Soleaferrea massiliensis]